VALHRGIDGSEPLRPEPITRLAGSYEVRRSVRTWTLATGTLACPDCDAPVFPGDASLRPADAISCPYCLATGFVRDFLSLAAPSRPARVAVRVVAPALSRRAARS
jgi:hypothetical protein